MHKLFLEFKRRNVFRAAALYLVSAWLIAQVADVVIGLGEMPPAVGRTVLVLLALGFPVTLLASWLFQWTPAGIRREPAIAADAPSMRPAGRRADYLIIALLSTALVYFAATHEWQGPPPAAGASIAVLPFENRSAQPDDLYFTDGIHEDILARLGRVGSLVVISRTSVMPYRNSGKTVPEIAGELGVATVLEGGVQRAGNRVRINLMLIDAASDRQLWTATYDRELTAENVFAIQSEVATAIADALQARLLPAEQATIDAVPTRNLEAYDAYLLGRRHLAARRAEDMVKARAYMKRAVDLDPTFAHAYAGLADTLLLFTVYGPREANTNSAVAALVAEAEAAARKALELNPDLGDAHTSFGLVRNWQGAPLTVYGPSLERGVELAPNSADARKWYAGYLSELNRKAEALEQYEKAVLLDPLSPIIRVNLAGVLRDLGRHEEARVQVRRALEIDPVFEPALFVAWESDSINEILLSLSQTHAAMPGDARILREFALNYLSLGDGDRAEEWTAAAERVAPGSVPALIARLNVSVFRAERAAAEAAAQGMLAHERGVTFPSRALLMFDLREGRLDAALARYRERYPALLGDDPEVGENYAVAADVAMLMQAMRQPDKAERLLERSLEFIATLSEDEVGDYGVMLARVHALRGQGEEALAALRAAVDAGWNFHWWFYLKLDPAFDPVRNDPRFGLLAEEMNAQMAWQLAKVRQLEASGRVALPP